MKYLSSLKNKDLSGRTCLLRVDLNLEENEIRSRGHLRIAAILPTIDFLLKNKAKIVVLSHRGRPKLAKQVNSEFRILRQRRIRLWRKNLEFSLKPFVKILSQKLNRKISFIDNFNFAEIRKKIENSSPGSVFLLENLRFLRGEEKNDSKLAKKLASLGDIYINDDFAVSHRKDASVAAIAKFIPSYAGFLLEKEIRSLNKVMKNPKKPLVIILGGAKISDKIVLIKSFLSASRRKVNCFLTGGGIANTFIAAQGLPVGDSLYEQSLILSTTNLLTSDVNRLIVPVDSVVYKRRILDIGPKTLEKYSKIIKNAKTIIWNGPMGYIEDERFAKGSKAIAKAIIKSKAHSVIGGGETTSLFGLKSYILNPKSNIFLSTGGGAMLEYLAGKKLPGIKALN